MSYLIVVSVSRDGEANFTHVEEFTYRSFVEADEARDLFMSNPNTLTAVHSTVPVYGDRIHKRGL